MFAATSSPVLNWSVIVIAIGLSWLDEAGAIGLKLLVQSLRVMITDFLTSVIFFPYSSRASNTAGTGAKAPELLGWFVNDAMSGDLRLNAVAARRHTEVLADPIFLLLAMTSETLLLYSLFSEKKKGLFYFEAITTAWKVFHAYTFWCFVSLPKCDRYPARVPKIVHPCSNFGISKCYSFSRNHPRTYSNLLVKRHRSINVGSSSIH